MSLSVYVLGREVATLEAVGDFKSSMTYHDSVAADDVVSLTMRGQSWALSAPLSLSGASSQSLAVESGVLSLNGPFVTPGGIFITSGGMLKLFNTAAGFFSPSIVTPEFLVHS